jgi:hypothetical protein
VSNGLTPEKKSAIRFFVVGKEFFKAAVSEGMF